MCTSPDGVWSRNRDRTAQSIKQRENQSGPSGTPDYLTGKSSSSSRLKKQGRIEHEASGRVKAKRAYNKYFKDGVSQTATEVIHCSFTDAVNAITGTVGAIEGFRTWRRRWVSEYEFSGNEAHDAAAPNITSMITNAGEAAPVTELAFNPAFLKKVDELELSVRTANCLKNDNVAYIGDLVQKTEAGMLRTPNFGRKCLNEIKEVLVQMGLHLGIWKSSRMASRKTSRNWPSASRVIAKTGARRAPLHATAVQSPRTRRLAARQRGDEAADCGQGCGT